MNSDSENHIRVSEGDLPILGFLPIWIFHSVCMSAYEPARISKLAMLKALEKHTEEEYMGLVGYFMGYLKTNLHKLFEYHYGTTASPDFSNIDISLTKAIDLLQTNQIEQPAFEAYAQFLRKFTLAVANEPCIEKMITEGAEIKLQVKARQILKLLE
jgi:hypothetical protein